MVKNQGESQSAISVTTEVLNWQNCQRIAAIDAKCVSTNCDKYMKDNVFQYYTCSNSWLLLIREILGDRAMYSVRNSIQRDGLRAVIDKACNLANQLIQYSQTGDPITVPMGWFMPNILDINLRDVLQTLRFPKRFTPNSADILQHTSFNSFLEVNKYVRQTNRMILPEWILARMREHVGCMLQFFTEEYKDTYPHFSAGSTTAGRTVAKKLQAYSEEVKYWVDPMYPIGDPTVNHVGCARFAPRITAVPKSYKTYRIIAPEHPYYAANKQRIKDAMRASIKRTHYGKFYDPECQEMNQFQAWIGSRDGEMATIDLTSASDTNSMSLVYDVFPGDFIRVANEFNSMFVDVAGKLTIKHMFATSGDPICFDTEAMTFLALVLSVQDICHELTGEDYSSPYVFGDDIVVDTRIFDSVLDVLTIMRFIPNMDKSFGVGGYRESCGVEYYYGYDVSTRYWPRKVVRDPRLDITSLESVIHLEQRMFEWWGVTQFLTDVITTVHPTVTSSEAGSDCADLWADSPWCALRCAPYDRTKGLVDVNPEWTRREAHTVFSTKPCKENRWSLDMDMYHYVNFLHSGPVYRTPLDELLRVSDPVMRTTDFGIPESVVRNVVT